MNDERQETLQRRTVCRGKTRSMMKISPCMPRKPEHRRTRQHPQGTTTRGRKVLPCADRVRSFDERSGYDVRRVGNGSVHLAGLQACDKIICCRTSPATILPSALVTRVGNGTMHSDCLQGCDIIMCSRTSSATILLSAFVTWVCRGSMHSHCLHQKS